jgi:hypothetical protein
MNLPFLLLLWMFLLPQTRAWNVWIFGNPQYLLHAWVHWLVLAMFSHAKLCLDSHALVGKASHFGVVWFTNSKWRVLVFQSIRRLCKMNHDNPMMIMFVKDEMTLNTTLLLCDPIVTTKALVSCVRRLRKGFDHKSFQLPLLSLSPPTQIYVIVPIPCRWNM